MLKINLNEKSVTFEGGYIELRKQAFEVLLYLARHPRWVVTKEKIIDNVIKKPTELNNVEVIIHDIRQQFGELGNQVIKTKRGFGYTLNVPVQIIEEEQ